MKKLFAFTLAEVLITLAVIGVVAALTLPGLIQNHNQKAWMTAKDLTEKKLVEATRRMNVDGVMSGVADSTEKFMDSFKKYLKVIKICDNSELENCYAPSMILTGDKEQSIDVTILKTAANLGKKDWDTNTVGFVLADGTTAIMAYDPNCKQVDIFSSEAQSGQLDCMAMLIDVNGKKSPNKVGKDIELKNATISDCDIFLGALGLCAGGSDLPMSKSINTCEGSPDRKYDEIHNRSCATNYWAAAKKECELQGMRLPTLAELAQIATYLYAQENSPIGADESRVVRVNSQRASELNWAVSSDNSVQYVASDDGWESSITAWIWVRRFQKTQTYKNYARIESNTTHARCVR